MAKSREQAEAMLVGIMDGKPTSEIMRAGGNKPSSKAFNDIAIDQALMRESTVRMLVPSLVAAGVTAPALAEAFHGGLHATMLVDRWWWEKDEETGRMRRMTEQVEAPDHKRRVETARIVSQLLQRDDELRQRQVEHAESKPRVPLTVEQLQAMTPAEVITELERIRKEGAAK